MFTNITWSNYSIAIGLLLLIWYSFLGFRFYYQEWKEIVAGKRKMQFPVLGGNKIRQARFESSDMTNSKSESSFSKTFCTLEDTEELSSILINAIREGVERNFSNEEVRMYLKLILNDYPSLKESSYRSTINELMVSECEKHPQMILTYAELDGLWDETI
jgi:hypothetical protein